MGYGAINTPHTEARYLCREGLRVESAKRCATDELLVTHLYVPQRVTMTFLLTFFRMSLLQSSDVRAVLPSQTPLPASFDRTPARPSHRISCSA